jgi:acyl-coenzyme A synthetase/AMP-(fatty) acid ligase
MITDKNLALGAKIVSQYTKLSRQDVILSPLRPNFDYGLNQIWQTMLIGAKLADADMRQPHLFYKKIQEISPTIIPLMPAIIKILRNPLLERLKKKCDLSKVRLVCSSGGKLSESDLDWLENTFNNAWICPMYGLTEAFRSTYIPEEFYNKKRSSIGIAIPCCEVKIIDKNDQELPPGQIGELVHFGGCISNGYLKLPDKTKEKFKPLKTLPDEKCVRSGDLAFKDEDGYIYFVGRNDEMIKSNGIRVSPTEIETELTGCSGVIDSMAFGNAALEQASTKIYCCIITNNDFDADLFKQEIKNKIPSHLRPYAYLIMKEFPLTGNGGKINRPLIKNLCLESEETQII